MPIVPCKVCNISPTDNPSQVCDTCARKEREKTPTKPAFIMWKDFKRNPAQFLFPRVNGEPFKVLRGGVMFEITVRAIPKESR